MFLTTVVSFLVAGASAQAPPVQVQVPLPAKQIPQFVQPLPLLGPTGIPVEVGTPGTSTDGKPVQQISLSMCEFKTEILPAGALAKGAAAPATSVWGYVPGACPATNTTALARSYLGPVIVAQRGVPTEVTYVNALGNTTSSNLAAYKQSVDQTLMWADPLGEEANACAEAAMTSPNQPPSPACAAAYAGTIPAAPHLHGGEIPAAVDGGPDAWWTGDGKYGHGYYSAGGTNDAASGTAVYTYPNTQEAAPIWFHDHVLGATRLNVYAGIAGAYAITDPRPGNLNYPAQPTLPTIAEAIPVVLQDRMFDTTGQLYFPIAGLNPEHPYWIPEFVGDVITVNGKAWPFLDVQPRRYRFLFLNGSNARAYELAISRQANSGSGPLNGPVMWVIGTDQGYLDKPAPIDPAAKPAQRLVIMPGERYEVIIDFAGFDGKTLLMTNTAATPYPFGVPADPGTTGRVMELRVAKSKAKVPVADATWNPAAPGATVRVAESIHRLVNPLAGTLAAGVTPNVVRRLTLNEEMGPGGPLAVLVNNTRYAGSNRPDFKAIATKWNTTWYSELPKEGDTEVWEIVNLTADAHPIHPHLVALQVMNREAFDLVGYTATYDGSFPTGVFQPGYGPPADYRGCPTTATPDPTCVGGNPDVTPFLLGQVRPPTAAEAGWKDTAISYPGEVLRLVIRFAPTAPTASHYEFDPGAGHGYVWHCHIIDHEDNEMMRPMSIQAKGVERSFVLPQKDPLNPLP
jgi:FtsP/CotA-like multicopper oxidase with cupredoxin domain